MINPLTAALAVISVMLFGTTMLSTGIAIALWDVRGAIRQVCQQVPVVLERLDRIEHDVEEAKGAHTQLVTDLAQNGTLNRRAS